MSDALSALAGVLAGGFVTAGVQYIGARTARAERLRVAARSTRAALLEFQIHVAACLKSGTWATPFKDWTELEQPWHQHRLDLAATVANDKFEKLSLTFFQIQNLRLQRADHLAQLADGRTTAERFDADMRRQLENASSAAAKASASLDSAAQSWRERLRTSREAHPPMPPDAGPTDERPPAAPR